MVTLEDIRKMGFVEDFGIFGETRIIKHLTMEEVPEKIKEEWEKNHKKMSDDMMFGVPYAKARDENDNVWYARFTYEKRFYEPYCLIHATKHLMRRRGLLLYCTIEDGKEGIYDFEIPSYEGSCTRFQEKATTVEEAKKFIDLYDER